MRAYLKKCARQELHPFQAWLTVMVPMLVLGISLYGCAKKAEAEKVVGRGGFNLETLFTDEQGCTMHRFLDAGQYVYYTTCPGITNHASEENCGKNCTHEVQHQTQTAEVAQ